MKLQVNQTIGNITVLSRAPNKNKKVYYKCRCNLCGTEYEARSDVIAKSYGCRSCSLNNKKQQWVQKQNRYVLLQEYGQCFLQDGTCFLFDLEDYDLIKQYCWTKNSKGYIVSGSVQPLILLHRLIMKCPKEQVVDHINHNILDNRKSNLRICTDKQNHWNLQLACNNKSGKTGVYWNTKLGKWHAQIRVDGHTKHLGYFADLQEAIRIRQQAEQQYFKEFQYNKEI